MKREVGLEQYFTSPKIAGACVDLLMKYYNLEDFDYVIEPSSGDGAFAMYLTDKTITIDIDTTSTTQDELPQLCPTRRGGAHPCSGQPTIRSPCFTGI